VNSAPPEHGRLPERRGFVLPLALFTLTVTALLVALLLEGAVQELRVARGEVAAARAQAAAGTALADLLASAPDSGLLARPRGIVAYSSIVISAETTRVALQALGNRLFKLTAGARAWYGGVRGDAANTGFAQIVTDSTVSPGSVRYRRLPGWWWAQLP
jgi:hypothetical protein